MAMSFFLFQTVAMDGGKVNDEDMVTNGINVAFELYVSLVSWRKRGHYSRGTVDYSAQPTSRTAHNINSTT